MALYAIGDLHLSLGSDKPMDVFGGAWVGYVDKLREGLSVIGPEDTTVLLGDLSWALDLNGAREDFAMIAAIPGRKIIVKGNHDYWWTTATKFYRFCEENGFPYLYLLNNNCYFYNGIALTGTRGWFFEEDAPDGSHNDKIFKRELLRLGIPPERIVQENRSRSTAENIRFSYELMSGQTARVGVLSNNFHIFRAVAIARKQGNHPVCGIAAPYSGVLLPHYMVREFMTLVVDKLRGNL